MRKFYMIIALFALGLVGIHAQTQYTMKVTKTDGTAVEIAADDIAQIEFVKNAQPAEVRKTGMDYYRAIVRTRWKVMYQDYDGVQTFTGATFTAPDESDRNYGKSLTLHLPEFEKESDSRTSLTIRAEYSYDEKSGNGTIALSVDDEKVGTYRDINYFLRLDNLPESDEFKKGEYRLDFKPKR